MPYRPHGKARVNANAPEAFGICDRCGSLYNRVDLRYQKVRAGNLLQQSRSAVCRRCLDIPRPPNSPVPNADPTPISNPRPEINRSPYPSGES